MHGTGPSLGQNTGWGTYTPKVWPGQAISSYIGVFVLAQQDEGTYELRMTPTGLYDFMWEGPNQWNDPTITLVINDSAERRGLWSPGQTLNPDWDQIYSTCLFTKGLTFQFHNPQMVPATIPYPEIVYISSQGGGGQVIVPYPLDTATNLQFNFGQAEVTDTITLQDPVDPVYLVHCKVYKFTLTSAGNVSFYMDDGGLWNSYIRIANIVNGLENWVAESDPNMTGTVWLDPGIYYILPQGFNTSDVGSFTLTVTI
jgi:hypothetical protein